MTNTLPSSASNNNNNNNNNNNKKNAQQQQYQDPVSGIDINCGCPQAIAKKGNYGAFLMENDFPSVCQIISTLKEDLPPTIGVSVKIRIPPEYSLNDDDNQRGKEILKE